MIVKHRLGILNLRGFREIYGEAYDNFPTVAVIFSDGDQLPERMVFWAPDDSPTNEYALTLVSNQWVDVIARALEAKLDYVEPQLTDIL